jgi:hypothetical protein
LYGIVSAFGGLRPLPDNRPHPDIQPVRPHRPRLYGIVSAFGGLCPLPDYRPRPGIQPVHPHRPTLYGIVSAFGGLRPLPDYRPRPGIQPVHPHRPTLYGIVSAFGGLRPLPDNRPHPDIQLVRPHRPTLYGIVFECRVPGRPPCVQCRPLGEPRPRDPCPPRRQHRRVAPGGLALRHSPAQLGPCRRHEPPTRVPSRFAPFQVTQDLVRRSRPH